MLNHFLKEVNDVRRQLNFQEIFKDVFAKKNRKRYEPKMFYLPGLPDSIKECEAFAIKILTTGVNIELSFRELAEFKRNLCEVNKVRRQRNVQEIPEEDFFQSTTKSTLRNYSLERLIAEMQAIDMSNGIPTDITTPSYCKKLKKS